MSAAARPSGAAARPWVATADGVTVTVRLTPKAGRDAIDGIEAGADGRPVLKARVRTPPSDGAANAALTRLIAATLGVPPRAVAIVAGHGARLKRLRIAGPAAALIEALERIAARELG